jgi:hypothetical protein
LIRIFRHNQDLSLGKTYFYNCKTEISQWEKPKGWPTDESSTSTNRIKKGFDLKKIFFFFVILFFYLKIESTNASISPAVRSRYKMEEFSHNGDIHSDNLQSNEISNNRLPSPGDDSSRMSFSSTSSKESSSIVINSERNDNVLHSSLSDIQNKDSNSLNDRLIEQT